MMSVNPIASVSRQRWVDLARALGAFLVVMTHTEYYYHGVRIGMPLYYSFTRAAVPLFFMASGYLLLSKTETLQDFFRKRAVKVLIPLLAWSVIYLVWKGEGSGKPFFSLIAAYALNILNRPSENHLWFLYALVGLYLFTPILRLYLQKAGQSEQLYYLGVWFFFTPIVFLLKEFTPIQVGIYYQYVGGYVGYFLFGYFIGHFPLQQSHKKIAFGVFILGFTITLLGMWYRQVYEVESQYFEEYLSFNVVMMSWGLFALLKDWRVSDRAYQVVMPLSRASFGIYLIHMMVIVELFQNAPSAKLAEIGHEIYMEPVLGLIAFWVSFLLVVIMQKIPLVKNIVPY